MRRRASLSCLCCAVLLAGGCESLQRYRPVDVLVRDVETNAPIAGADVRIWYPFTDGVYATHTSTGQTGADGMVHLEAAATGCEGVMVEGTRQGYLSSQAPLTVTAIRKVETQPWFGKAEVHPASVVIELLAEPRSTVELVVPTDFRGLIKIEVHTDGPAVVGKRAYRYEVPASGLIQVVGPHILERLVASDFRAQLADGTPLHQNPRIMEVGLRWLKCDATDQYFVVGTQSDLDRVRRVMERQHKEDERQQRYGGPARRVSQGHLPAPQPAP
jgi:hypothetical protein